MRRGQGRSGSRAWLGAFLLAAGALSADAAPVAGISYERFVLPNGLRVLLSTDSSVPVTALATVFDVGARHEPPGRSGFAHLFEHLMFEGSRNVPKGGFDRILESFGGDNNASTHEDMTFYYEEVPSNALPVALWLDADRFVALNASKEAVATQIEVVKEEKRMGVDNKPYGGLLNEAISSGAYVNWQNAHPIIGTFADLEAASLKDVKDFFDSYYAPANAIMAVVGDFDAAETRRRITELFGDWPARDKPAAPDSFEPEAGPGRTFELKDSQARLPAVALAWKGMPARGTRDFRALILLGSILFNGKGSRLYQELVKKSQVAVEVEGGLGFPVHDAADYRAPALFGAFVINKAGGRPDEVKDLLLTQIAKISSQGVPVSEVKRAKTKFRSDWILGQQTRLGRAQRLLFAALLEGTPEAANSLDQYLAVTPADIQSAAARYLRPELANVFYVTPGGGK
ncbi:MAG TPA: hypothetical protein DEB40_10395 [Elusimicrobia bacterium]|nr:hypothetical protein [Elusimicrobiota bacterium]HBT62139.1 hypothetical protein [Elusimicrobiota bacterium]